MALTINSPVAALRNMRALRDTQGTISDSFRRISSGVRVDTAADDPGRLGSTLLAEAKLRGLRQSIRNLNDGLSLTQTLEGGLSQITNALQRLRELSVQAGNETYNAADRQALQAEAEQMIDLIDKAVEQTKFNGINLMDGSAKSLDIFVDQPSGEVNSLKLDLLKVDTHEMSRQAHYESERRGVYLGTLSDGDLKINNVQIRGTTETDDDVSLSYKAGSAIAKAKAINSASHLTGVTARVAANVITANRAIGPYTLDAQNHFSINGVGFSGFHIEDFDATGVLRDTINSAHQETGVKAQLDSQGQLQLIAEDGRNIQIKYSNMKTMLSIGLADTSGDEINLKGVVEKSSQEPGLRASTDSFTPSPVDTSADYFGTIMHITQLPQPGSNITSFDVGGSFDPGVENIDYVVQFIEGGGFGDAKFRILSETASETDAAEAAEGGSGPDGEDFSFLVTTINGSANGSSTTGAVTGVSGAYFTPADGTDNNGRIGTIVVAGTYNEAPDRVYTLTVVSAGSTDGDQDHARIEVTTDVDAGVIAAFTVDSGVPYNLGAVLNQSGENLTIEFGGTPRGESISSSVVHVNASSQEYDAVFKQADSAIVGTDIALVGDFGAYTGDVNMVKRIEVVETGYTQGDNLAKLRVTNTVGGVTTTSVATFSISADTNIDIGDGLSINFPGQTPEYVGVSTGDVIAESGGGSGSYETEQNVTLISSASDFVDERGDGTYILDVTKAGITGVAEYQVLFRPANGGGDQLISAGATISAINGNTLVDGVALAFEDSTPSIETTTNNAAVPVTGNEYADVVGDYAVSAFSFVGSYDGSFNDATVSVRVAQEGRVLNADSEFDETDAAQLEYTITGTAGDGSVQTVTGTTIARSGLIDIGAGVQFSIASASGDTQIQITQPDGSKSLEGGSYILENGALGYKGQIAIDLNAVTYQLGEDVIVSLERVGGTDVIVGDANISASGQIEAKLISVNDSSVLASKTFTATSGTREVIADGFGITFTNSFVTSDLVDSGVVDDTGTIDVSGNYNGAYGDRDLTVRFVNDRSASISSVNTNTNGVADVTTAPVLTDNYTGNFGTQGISIGFQGTQVALGGPGGISLDAANDTYTGVHDGDVSLEIDYVAPTFNKVGTADFNLGATGTYNGVEGDRTFSVDYTGTQETLIDHSGIDAGTITGVGYTFTNTEHSWNNTTESIQAVFTTANTLQFSFGAASTFFDISTFHGDGAGASTQIFDLETDFGLGVVNVDFTGATLTALSGFDIEVSEKHSFLIKDTAVPGDPGVAVTFSAPTSSTSVNLQTEGFFASDPGFTLDLEQSTTGNSDSYTFSVTGPKATVHKLDVNGNRVVGDSATVDISTASGAEIDLDATGLFTGSPGVVLDIANPLSDPGGVWTVDLTTKTEVRIINPTDPINGVTKSVTVNPDGTGTLDLDSVLTSGEKSTLFGSSIAPDGDDTLGLVLTFTDVDKYVDDVVNINFTKTPRIEVEKVDGSGFASVAVPADGNVSLTGVIGAADSGLTLNVTDGIKGFDDVYTLELRTSDITSDDTDVAELNVRSLQENDTWIANLTGDVLEIGDQYAVEVKAPHLNAGTTYTITENVDRLEVGDTMTIDVNSVFEPTVYTAQSSVAITNGLTLEFGAGSSFEVGDELRFQASGYRGGFSVFGQYTDPAYPTTIEVEVITEGDVDGAPGSIARLRAHRLDGGPINDALADDDPANTFIEFDAVSTAQTLTVGGAGYIGKGVFMQFDPNTDPDAAHRLYKGDKFYIDVIGSLSQNFASKLVLESEDNILLEYSETNVDNKLGRMLYVGDPDAANNPGTIGSLNKAVLAVNTEFSIAKLDLTSQEGAEDALVMIDHAIGRIDQARTKMGGLQNRMTSEISALSEAAFQTERYGSRIKDADIANEVAELSSAQIRQQAGIDILRQINESGSLSLMLVESLIR